MKNCKGYELRKLSLPIFSLKMKLTVFFIMVSFFSIQANNYQQSVSGIVTDNNGLPIPGCNWGYISYKYRRY